VKSAGNDIVALNAIDIPRTISPAFYSKFVTTSELQLYQYPPVDAIPFQNFIWLLWSVKESAYKYLKRAQPNLIFSPSKITIQDIAIPTIAWEKNNDKDSFFIGDVVSGGHQLHFCSKTTTEFIASIVNDDTTFEDVFWNIKQIDQADNETQSSKVRELVLSKLATLTGYDYLCIKKNAYGCPIILQGENELAIPVSLAHHGCFVAYSFYAPRQVIPIK